MKPTRLTYPLLGALLASAALSSTPASAASGSATATAPRAIAAKALGGTPVSAARRRKCRRHRRRRCYHPYIERHGRWADGQGQGESGCGGPKDPCPPVRRYSGKTNQIDPKTGRRVTVKFKLQGGETFGVRTVIVDHCRSGVVLRVVERRFWPGVLRRKKHHRHAQFSMKAGPKKQSSTFRGTKRGSLFTGTLSDISPDPSGPGMCRGFTRWRATLQ